MLLFFFDAVSVIDTAYAKHTHGFATLARRIRVGCLARRDKFPYGSYAKYTRGSHICRRRNSRTLIGAHKCSFFFFDAVSLIDTAFAMQTHGFAFCEQGDGSSLTGGSEDSADAALRQSDSRTQTTPMVWFFFLVTRTGIEPMFPA